MHRVLIVDDDPFLLEGVRRLIARSFEPIVSQSGSDALQKLKSHGPFSAVVSDMNMRGMNGIEFLEQARGIAPDTPRVMFSGYSDQTLKEEAFNRAGVFRFLEKPVSLQNLRLCLDECAALFENEHGAIDTGQPDEKHDTAWIARSLRKADFDKEFELVFQPAFSLDGQRLESVEALLRWTPPDARTFLPEEFISIAEETGDIREIALWVLLEACEAWKAWRNEYELDVAVSVNISPMLLQTTQFAELIGLVLSNTGIPPMYLELEFTKGLEEMPTQKVHEAFSELRKLGVRLAIDGFGTDFISVSYLHQLDINRIKIDRNFIQGASTRTCDKAMLRVLRALTDKSGVKTVAVGVETAVHQSFVRDTGINQMQGDLLMKPLSRGEFQAWIDTAEPRLCATPEPNHPRNT